MASKKKVINSKVLRADAQRNRERILEAAKHCFAKSGDVATIDEIVKEAGVGIGTLYRHFETREALVEAVYISEHENLVYKAQELEKTMPPIEALKEWLLLFVEMLATKRAMKESLNIVFTAKPEVQSASKNMMEPTVRRLLKKAEARGEIHIALEPLDLLRALVGIAYSSSEPSWHENSRKFVEVLIVGMRTKPSKSH